eukprot:6418633-Prymnesium_polylepis.1
MAWEKGQGAFRDCAECREPAWGGGREGGVRERGGVKGRCKEVVEAGMAGRGREEGREVSLHSSAECPRLSACGDRWEVPTRRFWQRIAPDVPSPKVSEHAQHR